MRVQCISAQELQRFIYCSCPAHNEQLSKLVHLSQSYYVACMTLLHSLLRFASCFSKCFPFWLTLETDAFSRVFFVHWKRWLIVSYGLFRVPFFCKKKTLIPSAIFLSQYKFGDSKNPWFNTSRGPNHRDPSHRWLSDCTSSHGLWYLWGQLSAIHCCSQRVPEGSRRARSLFRCKISSSSSCPWCAL